eukprot:297086_1
MAMNTTTGQTTIPVNTNTGPNWEAYQQANRKRCCCCGTCSCCGKLTAIFLTIYCGVGAILFFSNSIPIIVFADDESYTAYNYTDYIEQYGFDDLWEIAVTMTKILCIFAPICFIIGLIGLFAHRSKLVLAPIAYFMLSIIFSIIISVMVFIKWKDSGILDKMPIFAIVIFIGLILYSIGMMLPFILIFHTNYKLIKQHLGR